jgi:hypothetical protein
VGQFHGIGFTAKGLRTSPYRIDALTDSAVVPWLEAVVPDFTPVVEERSPS